MVIGRHEENEAPPDTRIYKKKIIFFQNEKATECRYEDTFILVITMEHRVSHSIPYCEMKFSTKLIHEYGIFKGISFFREQE